MTNSIKQLTGEELELAIYREVKSGSIQFSRGTNFSDECESYLMIRVWKAIMKDEKYQNLKGIRQYVRTLAIDFYRKARKEAQRFTVMSAFDTENGEGELVSLVDVTPSCLNESEDQIVDRLMMNDYIEGLTGREREIMSLLAQNYQVNEIADELGIHRNTIQNTLKRLRDNALDFGYWQPLDQHNVFDDYIDGNYTSFTSIPNKYNEAPSKEVYPVTTYFI